MPSLPTLLLALLAIAGQTSAPTPMIEPGGKHVYEFTYTLPAQPPGN